MAAALRGEGWRRLGERKGVAARAPRGVRLGQPGMGRTPPLPSFYMGRLGFGQGLAGPLALAPKLGRHPFGPLGPLVGRFGPYGPLCGAAGPSG